MPAASAGSEPALPEPSRAVAAAGPAAASARRWGDLRLRVASAAILAPFALACVWIGGVVWYGLMTVAFCGVAWEWRQMTAGRSNRVVLAGFLYAALATAALAWLRNGRAGGSGVIFFLLGVVWCSDIGAYLAGRLIGGKRLAPAISPGKTWSGAAGGLLAAVVGGLVMVPIGNEGVRAGFAAALLGVASQCGDLAESALKRRFGVKDSGRLIPGHGGLLDRLDGLMAAALLAGAWLSLAGRGDAMWL